MADLTTLRRSPLAHLEQDLRDATVTGPRAVAVQETPFLTLLSVRVNPGAAAGERVSAALGAPLPTHCGQTSSSGAHTTLWLGPDEWLVVSTADADPLVRSLLDALAGDPGSVVDVSANRTTVELSGPSARLVLEKGCPVDLHPWSFAPGMAVATVVGPVPVLLWQVSDASFRLLPRSSFADYLARWLIDAMREFGAAEVT